MILKKLKFEDFKLFFYLVLNLPIFIDHLLFVIEIYSFKSNFIECIEWIECINEPGSYNIISCADPVILFGVVTGRHEIPSAI